jgi:hypothetical protein
VAVRIDKVVEEARKYVALDGGSRDATTEEARALMGRRPTRQGSRHRGGGAESGDARRREATPPQRHTQAAMQRATIATTPDVQKLTAALQKP